MKCTNDTNGDGDCHMCRYIIGGCPNKSKPPYEVHELKTDPEPWDAVSANKKRAEIRKADRSYKVGDHLFLRKTRFTGQEMRKGAPLVYTGDVCERIITHILKGPAYGIPAGFVPLSIAPPVEDWERQFQGLPTT